jgi:hypothetical protein
MNVVRGAHGTEGWLQCDRRELGSAVLRRHTRQLINLIATQDMHSQAARGAADTAHGPAVASQVARIGSEGMDSGRNGSMSRDRETGTSEAAGARRTAGAKEA